MSDPMNDSKEDTQSNKHKHKHKLRFDGDGPYVICPCGHRADAITGKVITYGKWEKESRPKLNPSPTQSDKTVEEILKDYRSKTADVVMNPHNWTTRQLNLLDAEAIAALTARGERLVAAAHLAEVDELILALGPPTNDDEMHVMSMLEDRRAQLTPETKPDLKGREKD